MLGVPREAGGYIYTMVGRVVHTMVGRVASLVYTTLGIPLLLPL